MSRENTLAVKELTNSMNDLFDSVRTMSRRSLFLFFDITLLALIVLAVSYTAPGPMGPSPRIGESALVILIAAVVGSSINEISLDFQKNDIQMYKGFCDRMAEAEKSGDAGVISDSIMELSYISHKYMAKYKMINIINQVTIAMVSIMIVMLIATTI